jgi:hypothetical protein
MALRVRNGKMPPAVGEIGLTPVRNGDIRQIIPGFFLVQPGQQRPSGFMSVRVIQCLDGNMKFGTCHPDTS